MPNLAAYDPAFAYEVAVIVRDGIARMYGDAQEDVFYYLTLYNENYPMPPMPDGVEDGMDAVPLVLEAVAQLAGHGDRQQAKTKRIERSILSASFGALRFEIGRIEHERVAHE